ncbi:MAG: hypothetical protein MRECE_25c011 [Mycoplasmataceae bacterium CE_OT135]|nr:MAG: hypothetical protein MRECE_25c011 [Mycoplasmataceae bacterium CE_OT135]
MRNGAEEKSELKKWWKEWKKWILGIFVISGIALLLILGLPLLYPDLVKNWEETSLFVRSLLIFLLFAIPAVILYSVFSFSSKYKGRKEINQ